MGWFRRGKNGGEKGGTCNELGWGGQERENSGVNL